MEKMMSLELQTWYWSLPVHCLLAAFNGLSPDLQPWELRPHALSWHCCPQLKQGLARARSVSVICRGISEEGKTGVFLLVVLILTNFIAKMAKLNTTSSLHRLEKNISCLWKAFLPCLPHSPACSWLFTGPRLAPSCDGYGLCQSPAAVTTFNNSFPDSTEHQTVVQKAILHNYLIKGMQTSPLHPRKRTCGGTNMLNKLLACRSIFVCLQVKIILAMLHNCLSNFLFSKDYVSLCLKMIDKPLSSCNISGQPETWWCLLAQSCQNIIFLCA